MQTNITNFPNQRLPINKKGKEWRERHLTWAENARYLNNGKIRKSLLNKKINFDLYAGILHEKDLKLYLNPYNKVSNYIPTEIQHYPIMNLPLDLLVGEEASRKWDMIAIVANPDAVSQLEEDKQKLALERIGQFLQSDTTDTQGMQEEASEIQKYFNYKYQDMREIQANWVLNDAFKSVDFKEKLRIGLKNVLIVNEEIYLFDIVEGEVVMEVINPKKIYTFRGGQSSRIEDSDIIIIEDYWSPGRIQDTWFSKLKKKDYDYLDELITNPNAGNGDNIWIDPTREFIFMPEDDPSVESVDNIIRDATSLGFPNSEYTDADGNIRVLRIYWKSQRKLLKLKTFDPETGDVIEKFVSEGYVPRKELGEETTTYWVNEWWQGTKVGKSINLDIKPKEIQYRRMSNPSYCHPGIVGQVYATNQLQSQSMVDKMKPTAYLFDAVMDRLIKTLANNVGNVTEVDLAKIAWSDVDKFLHFIRTDNIAFVNSFKEDQKGRSAGQFNTMGGQNYNFDQSATLQFYSNYAEVLKNSMWDMVGITPQRLGEISNRETLGGVERSVTQSSHVTAELFAIHDNVKKRCAEILLETAKYAMKGNKIKAQYITDDGVRAVMDIDGDEFAERDYGIYVENDLDTAGLRQKLENIAHAWSQNDTVKPSTLLSIFTDKSMESIKRKLEADYDEKMKQQIEASKAEQQVRQQEIQSRAQAEQQKLELEHLKLQLDNLMNQRDNATKIQIKAMESSGEEDNSEMDKLALQRQKLEADIKLNKDKLAETIRTNKAKEQISRNNKNTK